MSKAIFRQEALVDQELRVSSKKSALSVSKGPSSPEDSLVLFTSHFSLLTGLENAAGGFFQQTHRLQLFIDMAEVVGKFRMKGDGYG